MKYIRTKDKIYELKENNATQTPEEVQIALMTGNYKQADNPVKLCDTFVYEYKNPFYKNASQVMKWLK